MAGSATQTITVAVSGIGDSYTVTNTKAMTVPVAYQHGYTVVSTAQTTAIALFAMIDHIPLAKIYGVYLKCEVGTLYILVDTAGTATFAAAAADLVLNVGEACYLPINPTGNLGLCIDGVGVTTAFSWLILGQT